MTGPTFGGARLTLSGAMDVGSSAPSAITMTSREIADLVESRHDDVKRSIERLAERSVITLPPLAEVSNPGLGPRVMTVYQVGKRDSYIIVAQLSPEFTARLVDRWQELEAAVAAPQFVIPQTHAAALRLAADLADENQALTIQVSTMTPKVEALTRLALADGSLCITSAAKHLQVQPKFLFSWLSEHQWIYRRPGRSAWLGYQSRIQSGLLEHKVNTVERSDGSDKITEQCRITPRGLAKLAELLKVGA